MNGTSRQCLDEAVGLLQWTTEVLDAKSMLNNDEEKLLNAINKFIDE